eukprot:85121-Hanusia_phi.AAC.8
MTERTQLPGQLQSRQTFNFGRGQGSCEMALEHQHGSHFCVIGQRKQEKQTAAICHIVCIIHLRDKGETRDKTGAGRFSPPDEVDVFLGEVEGSPDAQVGREHAGEYLRAC